MFNPSSDWTKEERNEVIQLLCEELMEYSKYGRFVPPEIQNDIAEAIIFLTTKDSPFLEGNRNYILGLITLSILSRNTI